MGIWAGYHGTPEQRLLAKCIPEPNSGCWLWLGGQCNPRYGYGAFSIDRRNIPAHRASWLIFCGPIAAGLEVDHKCKNPHCVNPEHLRLATKAINLAHRTKERLRCARGHYFSGENLLIEANGFRRCRQCREASKLKTRGTK